MRRITCLEFRTTCECVANEKTKFFSQFSQVDVQPDPIFSHAASNIWIFPNFNLLTIGGGIRTKSVDFKKMSIRSP